MQSDVDETASFVSISFSQLPDTQSIVSCDGAI